MAPKAMKLHVMTIVLDGMLFLPAQFYRLNQCQLDWRWYIAEGVAAPTGSTAWCKPQEPRLSKDGTALFLDQLSGHPRVTLLRQPLWEGGKDEMVNALLAEIQQPGVLLQMDADEIWTTGQLRRILLSFATNRALGSMQFFCRYFVGPNLVTIGEDCYGNYPYEWVRAWRFAPGDRFEKHEPPVLIQKHGGRRMTRQAARNDGLVFDHYAYAFREQAVFKELYYGYAGAAAHWDKLQRNARWPASLIEFLPWVDAKVKVQPLYYQ